MIMDLYHNATTLSIEEQEDEPFYCSPACAEGDVIWPGSDSEETAEETEQKRLRYEHHARRYLRGHLPVLQSATLRGPLSGWINPWRWVPKHDEWWQPGSEDMLFTREKVMKRAADHGLGYLGPTEALAWCKASAQAEAQRMNRHGSAEQDAQPEVGNTLIELDTEEPRDNLAKAERLTHTLDPTNPYENQSMVNHHSVTPHIMDHVGKETRGTKRPVNAHWLKGSYVSKRARWDGPDIATPTPQHEMGDKSRRRHKSFPERSDSNNRTSYTTSRLSVSFEDITSPPGQMDVTLDTEMPDITSHDRGQASVASAENSTDKKSSFEQNVSTVHDDNDEFHEISRSAFTSSLQNRSGRRSQRRSRCSTDASLLIVEPDELDTITPLQHSPTSILPSSGISQNVTLSSISNKLPERRSKPLGLQHHGHLHDSGGDVERSFITEVAPSSRDLEMFQYRKRRKRKDSEVVKPNQNARTPAAHLLGSPGLSVPSGQSDENENLSYDECSIEPEMSDKINVPPHHDEAPIAEDEPQGKSNQSDRSWDFMDDAMENLPVLSAGSVTPAKSVSLKQHIEHISPVSVAQVVQSISKISSQRSKMSLGSSDHSQTLADPRKSPSNPPAAKGRVGIFQDLNGSTQSYNTSPLRPTPLLPLEPRPHATNDKDWRKATSSMENQDMVSNFQKPPSQHGPRFSSPAGTGSNKFPGLEIGDLGEMERGPLQNPPLNHVPHSSHANISSQTSVEGNEATTDRELDQVAEIANVGQSQRGEDIAQLQRTPQRQFSGAERPERGAESGAEASSAISISRAKDNCHKEIKEPQLQTSIQSEVSADLLRDEIPVSGTLGESRGRTHTGPKASNIDSETSWEGCGPQSPWAAENLQLPVNNPGCVSFGAPSTSGTPPAAGLDQRLSSPDSDPSEELDWHHVERPQTPATIMPFKDLMSPTPEPDSRDHHLEINGLPNTQALVDAATTNPWTSNLKNPSSKKSNKRVSFNVIRSEQKENTHHKFSDEIDRFRPTPRSPPPPQHESDEDIYDDGTATAPKFIGHFVTARQFKQILPPNTSSPLNSSPNLGAQAEAFIAADRRASVEERRARFSPRPPSRKPKAGRHQMEVNSWTRDRTSSSAQISPKSPEKRVGNLMASFDMEDAIGDMSDFLGNDWSVDAELKKAQGPKESESSGRRESNGHKRRRLFGLV